MFPKVSGEMYNLMYKQFGNLTHFPYHSKLYFTIDNMGNIRKYSDTITGINAFEGSTFGGAMVGTFIILDSNSAVFSGQEGVLFIEDVYTDPKFKYIYKTDLPEFPEPSYKNSFFGFDKVYVPHQDTNFFYFYLYAPVTTSSRNKGAKLIKLNSSMTEAIAVYPFYDNKYFSSAGILSVNGKIWIATNTALIEFDIVKEEFVIYDNDNNSYLPFTWSGGNSEKHRYIASKMFLDWDEYDAKPIVLINSKYQNSEDCPTFTYLNYKLVPDTLEDGSENTLPDGTIIWKYLEYTDSISICTDNALLYFNRETNLFDTIRLNFPDGYFFTNIYKCNKSKKIVLRLNTMFLETDYSDASFLLYDWETKTYQILTPPDSIFSGSPGVLRYADDYIDAEGNLCIGLLYSNNNFIAYNLKTGIFSNESKLLPDLWFRKVYPNPTRHNITADIMCYLPSVSSVELGLYDLLGSKVLDLSNNFEYDQSTATIYTSFQLPAGLSTGTYLLVVKSGDETRSKAIIVE